MAKRKQQEAGKHTLEARIANLKAALSQDEQQEAEKMLKVRYEIVALAYCLHPDRAPVFSGKSEWTKRQQAEIDRAKEVFGEKAAEKLIAKLREEKAAAK